MGLRLQLGRRRVAGLKRIPGTMRQAIPVHGMNFRPRGRRMNEAHGPPGVVLYTQCSIIGSTLILRDTFLLHE